AGRSRDCQRASGRACETALSPGRFLGSLRDTFSNIPQRAQTLVTRWKRGVYRDQRREAEPRISDARGPLVRRIETAQTFLTASEIDRLVGDYLAGATGQERAETYGIHRGTVFAHLTGPHKTSGGAEL